MHQNEALTTLSALAQATRLKVLVILSGLADPGMASSDIADAVGVPRHLMSAHLAVLSRAGLVDTLKTGRSVTYTVRREALRELGDYLARIADGSEKQPSRSEGPPGRPGWPHSGSGQGHTPPTTEPGGQHTETLLTSIQGDRAKRVQRK